MPEHTDLQRDCYATTLREVAQWTREDVGNYDDPADCEHIAVALEAGADALEENQQLRKHLGKVERAAEAFLEAAEGVPQNVPWDQFQTKATALQDALDQARQARHTHQPTPAKDQP